MSQIIQGAPLRYRIVIEGEFYGLSEYEAKAVIEMGLSFSARLAQHNRLMQIAFLTPTGGNNGS